MREAQGGEQKFHCLIKIKNKKKYFSTSVSHSAPVACSGICSGVMWMLEFFLNLCNAF